VFSRMDDEERGRDRERKKGGDVADYPNGSRFLNSESRGSGPSLSNKKRCSIWVCMGHSCWITVSVLCIWHWIFWLKDLHLLLLLLLFSFLIYFFKPPLDT